MSINIKLSKRFVKNVEVKSTLNDLKLTENLNIRKINKKDCPNFNNLIISKPWGLEYLCGCNKNLEVWELHINPKSSTSLHCHPEKDTLNLVIGGNIILETLGKKKTLKTGEFVILKAGAVHRTFNNSDTVARVLEIESPPNKYNLVRIQDSYGRQSKGYVPLIFEKRIVKDCCFKFNLKKNKHFCFNDFIKNKYELNDVNPLIIDELILNSMTLKESKKQFLAKLKQNYYRNAILLEGSIFLFQNKRKFAKLLAGDCVHDFPLWKLNWSSQKSRILIW